jgi:Tol biopolymer transport system component
MQMWKTKISVVNADGTDLRELTDGQYADVNQTWTRDGTNQIIFNRFGYPNVDNNAVYITSPDAKPGDEIRISHPRERFEWAFSALRDGRIFIERTDRIFIERTDMTVPGVSVTQSFLMTPNVEGIGFYEEIERPTTKQWHTLSVSPSETKVAYMLDNDDLRTTYGDAVLYYADFDVDKLTISNPVQIADEDSSYVDMYTRWSADESLIIYSSNRSGTNQTYVYRLSDGTTHRISYDKDTSCEFAHFEDVPK